MPFGEISLQALVRGRIFRMITEPVTEAEVALFPLAALPAHMDMERSPAAVVPAEELVLVGPRVESPPIAELNERVRVGSSRHHRSNRYLDVDHRLGAKLGYRGRTDMFHASDLVSKRRLDPG